MAQQKNTDLSTFDIMLISAISGIVLLLVGILLSLISEVPTYMIIIVFVVVYSAVEAFLCIYARKISILKKSDALALSLESHIADACGRLDTPIVITNSEGTIAWVNTSMQNVCEVENSNLLVGKNLSVFTGVPMNDIIQTGSTKKIKISLSGKHYDAITYLLAAADRDYWMTVFTSREELDEAIGKINHESPVVAYIVIDNLEELAQYVRVSYREAANEVEGILRTWAGELSGLMREYDRDKYLLIFPKEKLAECTESRFDILDRVRNVGLGDRTMSVTISIGVCATGDSFFDREIAASAALETALQRGGDQVALRTAEGIEFFGGRTKIQQKRTKVRSRVIADRLIQLISDAGNVLIMGHKNPDFDSIGSCIGLARLALGYNPNVKVVIDTGCSNFKVSAANIESEVEDFKDIFVDSATGLDLIRSDTLLIVTDVNNLKITEAPEIAENVFQLVIIDHHRKISDFENEPLIAYIEPSASSASELVSEILEICSMGSAVNNTSKITKHEANIMLSGIMLDTKNFTRSTSDRTFSAALYLREAGADPEYVRTFFYADLDNFVTESRLGSDVRLYRERIAISVSDGTGSPDDRIAASKTADTLLSVRQVDAAFVLLRTGDSIVISARSNGSINVQLILEKIGGGGHFDAAGAQIKNTDSRAVLEMLKGAIDGYLDADGEAK